MIQKQEDNAIQANWEDDAALAGHAWRRTYQVSLRGLAASTRQRKYSVLSLDVCNIRCQQDSIYWLF